MSSNQNGPQKRNRVRLLPKSLVEPLREHLARVKSQRELAMEQGYGGVALPELIRMHGRFEAPPMISEPSGPPEKNGGGSKCSRRRE